MAKKIDDVAVETFYPSEIVDIETLRPWPRNYKIHDDNQTGLLGQSLGDFGQAKNVVVWRGPGDDHDFIVAGHGLVSGAKSKGWAKVEVKRLPSTWSVVQVESFLVADNSLAELSQTDPEKLANLLHSIRQENPRMLEPTGFDSEKIDAMLRELSGAGEPGADGDYDGGIGSTDDTQDIERKTLADRFLVPPFSVLDARQGYWQDRKRDWLALGIQSELGRGMNISSQNYRSDYGVYSPNFSKKASPGGSPLEAATLKNGKIVRGDGRGRELDSGRNGGGGGRRLTWGIDPNGQSWKQDEKARKYGNHGNKTEKPVGMAMHNDPMQRKSNYDKARIK